MCGRRSARLVLLIQPQLAVDNSAGGAGCERVHVPPTIDWAGPDSTHSARMLRIMGGDGGGGWMTRGAWLVTAQLAMMLYRPGRECRRSRSWCLGLQWCGDWQREARQLCPLCSNRPPQLPSRFFYTQELVRFYEGNRRCHSNWLCLCFPIHQRCKDECLGGARPLRRIRGR